MDSRFTANPVPLKTPIIILINVAIFLALFLLLRTLLLWRVNELADASELADLAQAFITGTRFDLRMTVYAVLPLFFTIFFSTRWYRSFCICWLSLMASMFIFLGLAELEFYREFEQRLNFLPVQYLREDPVTVLNMVMSGVPVAPYALLWITLTTGTYWLFRLALSRLETSSLKLPTSRDCVLFCVLFLVAVVCARGTLRSGPPLRWGDAYTTDNLFANHLALNGSETFFHALIAHSYTRRDAKWKRQMDSAQASEITLKMLEVPPRDHAQINTTHNVVIILLESFSAQFVGTLGGQFNVTPYFDALSEKGLLFTRFFSNGTHTHQGIFATLSCFPNLPGHEYLMQQPEGRLEFSGLTRLLPSYNNLFIYNGDFNWDNQIGFFRNQGVTRFIGRYDFDSPHFMDPVWGVSDEDMFNRAEIELARFSSDKPFVSYLQTLSNHLPYNLPEPLPFEPVSEAGNLSQRLTAMKYSDWALGRFFHRISDSPGYKNTIFVILGDHGFASQIQLTEINLMRFHVPMLIIGETVPPGRISTVGSQVDVIPTILGLAGDHPQHHCFGRDLLALPDSDQGFAIIKPSGDEPTTAIIEGNRILTFDHERGSHTYQYSLNPAKTQPLPESKSTLAMKEKLFAYIRCAYDFLDGKIPIASSR